MNDSDFEKLVLNHGREIYGFCVYLTGNRDEADDLYQDTLLKSFEVRGRIDGEDESGYLIRQKNYCMGIAVRLYRNIFRKKCRNREISIDDENYGMDELLKDGRTPEKIAEIKERRQIIRQAVEKLPVKQRSVILMFYYSEMSIQEISEVLGIPEGTVKSRLSTAKARLKSELGGIETE